MTGIAFWSFASLLTVFSMVACMPAGDGSLAGRSDSARLVATNEAAATAAVQRRSRYEASATAAMGALYATQTAIAPQREREFAAIRQVEAAMLRMLCVPMLAVGMVIAGLGVNYLRRKDLKNQELRLTHLLRLQQENEDLENDHWDDRRL